MSKPSYEELENQLTLALDLLNRALPLFGTDMPDIEEEAKVSAEATELVEEGPFSSRVTRVQKLERVLFLASQIHSPTPTESYHSGFEKELKGLVSELNAID